MPFPFRAIPLFLINAARRPQHPTQPSPPPPPPPNIKKKSLFVSAPCTGLLLFLTSVASACVLTIFFTYYAPQQPSALVAAFSVLFFLAHTLSLVVYTFHPCIAPPPRSPGRTIFAYFFLWVVIQAVGFWCVDYLWDRSLTPRLKGLSVAWMLLSLASISLWTFALIVIMDRRGRRCGGAGDVEAVGGSQRPRTRAARHVEDEEKPTIEHVEFREPPPAYFAVGVRRDGPEA